MAEDMSRDIEETLERGRAVELIRYKMLEELPRADIRIWDKHFAAAHLLHILCHRLAEDTPQQAMVGEILEGYQQFGKPYHQQPRPKFG